jgi:MFS family permease
MPGIRQDAKTLRAFAPALLLLATAILINYVDRGNLSVAAPLLEDELHVSPAQLGVLFSAFFVTYSAFIFVSGWLADRFNVNWVLVAGFTIWSTATAATGIVHGFAALFLMRLLLGVGESVAFPSSSKILARHLAEEHRGFANGLIAAFMKVGPAVATFGAGLLMAKYGWRSVFIGIGLASLAWLPAWMKCMPHGTPPARQILTSSPRAADLLRQRSFCGATLGHFCSNYVFYFMVTWLPLYLVHERGLSMQAMAKTAGAYYLVDAASALATGWFADYFIRRGWSVTFVRKAAMTLGHTSLAIAFAGCAFAGPRTYLAWLMLIGIGMGMSGSGIFAFVQTLAGPLAAGRWAGLQNCIANVAGILSPAVAGFVVDRTGHFTMALAITATVSLIAIVGWTLIVGALTETDWERTPPDGRSNSPVTRHQTTNRMFLAKARPISCNVCPAFQRRHTSIFCSAESPNRFPGFMNTTFESGFIPDGVASTV